MREVPPSPTDNTRLSHDDVLLLRLLVQPGPTVIIERRREEEGRL